MIPTCPTSDVSSETDVLHRMHLRIVSDLDTLERLRLLGTDPETSDIPVVVTCSCGATLMIEEGYPFDTAAEEHARRDGALPVHRTGAHSLIGTRARNADSFASAVNDVTGLSAIAVADGIGNLPGAPEAAAIAARTAVNAAVTIDTDVDADSGADANTGCNDAVAALLQASAEVTEYDPTGLGDTVMVVAVSHPAQTGEAITWDIAWVGDCRAYLFEDGVLRLLTTDHTHGQLLRARGVSEEIAALSDNRIYTTVGRAQDHPAEIGRLTVTTRGRLALFSDGVGKAVPHDIIELALTEYPDPDDCARELAELGASVERADNATALVIDTLKLATRS